MNINDNAVIDEKLLADHADFLKAVVGAKTVEEARAVCAEYNIDLPEDAWKDIQNSYRGGELCTDELSEDELDNVSGGRVNGKNLISAVAGVVGLGAVIAAGSAAGVLVACVWIGYYGYKTFR